MQPSRRVDTSLPVLSRLHSDLGLFHTVSVLRNACSCSSKCERSLRLFSYDCLTGPFVQINNGAHPSGAMMSPLYLSYFFGEICWNQPWNLQLWNVTSALLLNSQLFKQTKNSYAHGSIARVGYSWNRIWVWEFSDSECCSLSSRRLFTWT